MDTPQHPAPNHPPASDHAPATAEAHAPGAATDVASQSPGPQTPEAEPFEVHPEQQPSTAPQGTADASAEPASTPVSAVEDGDPSEGSAESLDSEAAGAAFDPAAFDAALNQVLSSAGGELLFRFAEDSAAGDKIAAVRLGDGEARLIALVILPPHGAPLRVEPAEESANPLAPLAKSYASLVDAWKAAA